jgi:hypothetical protein
VGEIGREVAFSTVQFIRVRPPGIARRSGTKCCRAVPLIFSQGST